MTRAISNGHRGHTSRTGQVDVTFLKLVGKDGKATLRCQYTAIDDATRIRALRDKSTFSPVEGGIGGLIDLAHAAFADEGRHVVMAEPGADVSGHQR